MQNLSNEMNNDAAWKQVEKIQTKKTIQAAEKVVATLIVEELGVNSD